jgi:amidophosphoribosyltransferase
VDALGFRVLRDIGPGEAVFIDEDGKFYSQQCAPHASLNPASSNTFTWHGPTP